MQTIIDSVGMYLNQPFIYNLVETVLCVAALIYLVWIFKLASEK